jgi:N-acetylglucosaminyl-diphospho-decaprenol L-rhamnosyltransferase
MEARRMTSCSVIMVSYHTGPVLFVSVKSVLRQQQLAELIVVDNGNPPDVLARLQQIALTEPRLKIVTGVGNAGFAKGCNLGIRQATGDYLLLLNPDCLLPPEALADLMVALDHTPDARLASGWMQTPEGTEQKSDRRRLLTPGELLAETFGLHHLLRLRRRNTDAKPHEAHAVSAISNACMCLRRKDYNRLGGMDEIFFLPVADLDLCMRIHKNGGRIICVPSVKVTHMPGMQNHLSPSAMEWQKAKGLMHYFTKHFQREYIPGFLLLVNFLVMLRFALHTTATSLYRGMQPKPVLARSVAAKKLMVLASSLTELPERNDLSGKTVLVTGATSQVGLCVIRRLLASGAAVLAISRSEPIPFQHEHLRWIKGDLTDSTLHLQGYLVDIVVYCAPLWHLPPTLDLLADAEVKRIIAFGTTSVFGKALSRNSHEKDLVENLSKAEREIAVRCDAKGIAWTLLRPTLTYGVGLDLKLQLLPGLPARFRPPPAGACRRCGDGSTAGRRDVAERGKIIQLKRR